MQQDANARLTRGDEVAGLLLSWLITDDGLAMAGLLELLSILFGGGALIYMALG